MNKHATYKKPINKSYKNSASIKKVDTNQDKAIKQLKKEVDKLKEEPEIKYKDGVTLLEIPDLTGTQVYWNLDIAQGDDYNERVGEEILLKKQEWQIAINSTPSTVTKRYRVIMFMDRQTNGNPPAILATTSATSGLLDNLNIADVFYSPHNQRCIERYKVYYDKLHIFNPEDSLSGYRKEIRIGKSFNTKIKYADSTATLTAITSKNIWVVVLGAQAALTGDYNVYARTYFTDS